MMGVVAHSLPNAPWREDPLAKIARTEFNRHAEADPARAPKSRRGEQVMTDARRNSQKPAEPGKGHGAKTAAVRERAILALLAERTIGAAAASCGVNEATLRRWLTSDDAFKAEYERARSAAFTAGMSRVHGLTAKAVNTLDDLLDAQTTPAVRLGAARAIAELALHQHDDDTILRKLHDIEIVQQQRR